MIRDKRIAKRAAVRERARRQRDWERRRWFKARTILASRTLRSHADMSDCEFTRARDHRGLGTEEIVQRRLTNSRAKSSPDSPIAAMLLARRPR